MEGVEPGGHYTRIGPANMPTFTLRVYPQSALICDRCRAVVKDWGVPWNYPEHREMKGLMEAHQCLLPRPTA